MSQIKLDSSVEVQVAEERRRLVRLCARVTGDPAIAEDLAQETLLEAWRHADDLRNPQARQAWLSGIARNVCRRWARARGRELSRIVSESTAHDTRPEDWLADDLDLELELERDELATLLDRAMELLPAETRLVLIQRYVEDAPQALIAERLGLSEGAVAMRLSRGRLAMRRILASDLYEDAVAFGLQSGTMDQWQPTRVWCSMCGVERLTGHFDPVDGSLMLRCPGCFPLYGIYQARAEHEHVLQRGTHGARAAYHRVLVSSNGFYDLAFTENVAVCPACGGRAAVHRKLPESELPRLRESRGAHIHCAVCDGVFHVSLGGLVLALPAARAFWQKHGRIRARPEWEIEVDGCSALVSRLESVTGAATLDVVTDAETLANLRIYADGVLLPR